MAPLVNRWANEVAEQRLIYEIFSGKYKAEVLDELEPEDFYNELHRSLFRIAKQIASEGHEPDYVRLLNATNMDTMRMVAVDFRKAVVDNLAYFDHGGYMDILHELRSRREVYAALHNAAKELQNPESEIPTEEVVTSTMEALSKGTKKDDAHDLQSVLMRTYDTICARNRGDISPVSTGIPAMDEITGGLFPGEMTVIGARPGTGKTALTLQIAEHAAKQGHRAVFISREMSDIQIGERILARHGINMARSRIGRLREDDWAAAQAALADASYANILIDNRSTTVAAIRTSCRRWAAKGGLDLICIDYLQLVHSENNGSRNDQVAAISWACKELSIELNVPVLVLSQLNRELKNRDNGEPLLTDLRDSGAVEQDADNVWLLYSPKTVDDHEVQALINFNAGSNRSIVAIKIAKARQSIPGTVYTQFVKDEMRFIGTEPEPLPEQMMMGEST